MHSGRMAHLHKKMKKGRPYYYVREMGRVGGKLKVIEQIYLGSPERIKELATADKGTCTKYPGAGVRGACGLQTS